MLHICQLFLCIIFSSFLFHFYYFLPIFHLSPLSFCLSFPLIPLVMSIHRPRLALSSLPADGQLPSPDELRPFVLWYETQHTHWTFFWFCRSIRADEFVLSFMHHSFYETGVSHSVNECVISLLIHSCHSFADRCSIKCAEAVCLEPRGLSVQLSIINCCHGFPTLPLTWQL